jgi:uncharacterized membrane protein YfcA
MANATSNMALLPGAAASAWSYRRELGPVGGLSVKLIVTLTFIFGLVGSLLLVLTPTTTFDFLIPWLLLFAFMIMLFGQRAAAWLHARVTIGRSTLIPTQCAIGIYAGYFGGGAGLILTAVYGLLANIHPRELFAIRVTMLGAANFAAAFIFIGFGMIDWRACVPMVAGSIAGGWLGAAFGKRISARAVRLWTLLVTAVTTIVFFVRAYG